jgi:hypothetical protein
VVATTPATPRTLAPGQSAPFSISAPMSSFDLRVPWQVYELGVQVNGLLPIGSSVVGGLRTFLPWAPVSTPSPGAQTQVAWIWPLVAAPHRSVGDSWLDDGLAGEIAEGGRLATLLRAGQAAQDQPATRVAPANSKKKAKPQVQTGPVPVTWAVDPMLAEDLDLMGRGYRVGTGRAAAAGRGAVDAKAWAAALRSAVGKGELLALPYADPDVVAAIRAGLSSQVLLAMRNGQALTSSLLGRTPLVAAWPPDGQLDQRSLDTLFAANVNTVVLDESAVPVVGVEPNLTTGAHSTVHSRDGSLDALLLDTGLDTVVAIGARDPAKQALAVQRFIAETLMIQAERPFLGRTLVVAPDRRWSPSYAYAANLLADTGRVPWMKPVTLSSALSSPILPVTRGPLRYTDRSAELSRGYLAQVRAVKHDADTFTSILTPGDPQGRTFDDAVLRSLSSAFRTDPGAGAHYRDVVAGDLASAMSRVRIASAPRSFVTLTSHSGTVPITVGNELNTPVHVVVAIESQHLTVSGGGRTAQTIPPHRQYAVDVRASAKTAGVFQLTVRLLTPSGAVYQQEQLFVRSTAYGTVAILITGAATGVLLLAVVIRLFRRGVRARRQSPTT